MNFFYANGTPIINSLKVTSEVPLDPRLTVENIAERDSLVTNHISYDRMKVYVKSNDTKYIYHKDTGEWEIDNKFSEEDKSKLDRIDNYLIDTEHIYNPENKLLYREHSYDPNTDITTLRDHILQEARVSENGELYNGLLSKFYVNRLNNITNYLIDASFTKGTDVPNLYLTTHSYNPDEDKTTLTNIDIPLATDDNHGLLSNLQNIKVNRIVDYVNRIDTTHTNAPDTGLTYNYNIYNPFTNANVTKTILIPLVTHTENGLTSSSDKIKIDDIETYVKSIALRQASGTEELGIDYIITNPNDQTDTPGYFNIPLVTDSRNGLVSPARKHWMDNASGVSNTGTTSDTWQLDKKDIDTRLDPNGGVIIKDSGGIAEIRNSTDSAYSDLTLNNITIKGDVTLEGKSFITEAETVEVRDNTLLLNRGETGAGVSKEFAGIEIDRGSEPKYQILFDESDDRFKVGKEGDLWCVTLRDDEADMVNGMFTTWDSSTKRLKTTNIVPESTPLLFGRTNYKQYSGNRTDPDGNYSSYAFISEAEGNHLYNFSGSSNWNIDTDKINFRFWKPLLGTTFKRASDNSEVLYHADIVNNLTSGGTNKVLSAEQGKILQNSITSIQGSYLPLSGGTMTGSINLPSTDPLKMIISGSVDSVLSYWPSNNAIEFGNNKRKIFLRTDNSNIIHYINGSSYSIYDAYNLPDPVTLSGNNTFTGNNTFQAGKFNVGPFKVTSSGSLWSNISSPAGSAWSRSLVFRANNDIPSSLVFGGYNSVDNTNLGYAYIGIGDINYQTVQYKFYANSLRVPYQWSIDGPDGAAIIWSQTSEIVNLGRAAGTTKIRSGNTDLIHTKGSTEYIIWDKSNLPNPASTTDLANYLPLIGGTLTGQLTIKQSVDIKLRLQSTDADNHCIIQAINAQASQLGVFGYAGDKWAIGHGGTYYEIWDKYNLTNPVTYTTNTYNHAILTNKDGQYFTYIKAGTNGLLPHSKVALASGGSGLLGTSDQSFNAAYINNLHTNKVTFGETGPYITGSTSAIQFLNAEGGVQKVATGGLYVGPSYASDALSLVPANGIYSRGIIYIENGIGFRNSIWTNDLTPNRNYSGYLQVLDAYDANNAGGPTNYGTVLQINSRNAHWANQLWFSGGAEASKNGLYYRHMAYNETTYGEWHRLLTNKDVNIIQTQSSSNPSTLPVNQIFYSETKGVAGTPTPNGLLFSVQGDDEGIQLWAGSNRTELYYRTKWTSFGNWIKLATKSDIGKYLPLAGGKLTSTSSAVLTIDSTRANETYMRVSRNGTSSAAIGFMDGLGAYIYNNYSNKYLFIDNDGYARVGTTSGSTRLALITDIPSASGYATQSWVNTQLGSYVAKSGDTMTGKLTARGGINLHNNGKIGISFYLPSFVTWVDYLTPAGSGEASTGGTASSYGNVTSWARRSTIEQASGYGWIWDSCKNASGADPTPRMALSSNNGNLYVQGTITSNGKTVATIDQIPSIPSISISNSGSGNAVTSITASGHTLTVTKGATYLTSSSLDGYATQTWANGQFAPLSRFNTSTGYTTIKVTGQEFNFDSANPEIYMNYRTLSGSTAVTKITWKAGGGANSTALCEGRWGNLYMNNNLVATQSWAAEKFPNKTGAGASGTWGISISGNATTATTASKLGSTTIGGSAKPIYLSSGTPTACSATVGSATVPVYMNAGTITQCSTTLGVSITGNAATATTATKWNGYSIWTGTEDELPSSRDANTLYFVKKSS